MGKTFEPADKEVLGLIDEVMQDHHPDLKCCGLQLRVLMAHAARDSNDNPRGPALKHQGYQAAAIIKVLSLKERVLLAGKADAVLTIDGDRWDDWTWPQQRALIDHELTHLVPQWLVWPAIDDDGTVSHKGEVKTDDIERPKLRIRLHDMVLGGFGEVLERHGVDAMEHLILKQILEDHEQLLLPFMEAAA